MAGSIRPAFSSWPDYNRRLRDAIAHLTGEQLAIQPATDRWPLWATIGHLACQRVFWLCDFAGVPGADSTPFPNAAYDCPGDDDLDHPLDARQLVAAIDSTFAIVEQCLRSWSFSALDEVITHPEWGDGREHTRGFVIQRVFAHDVWHMAELNEAFSVNGLPLIDPWA
jgi:uncharacterized damage-inducible protein DinB